MKNKISIKKIIFTILTCFVVTIGIAVAIIYSTVTSINKVYPSEELVFNGGDKKALLIYEPSRSSLSKDVALKTAEIMQKNGYTVTMNCPSNELNYDLQKYDFIVFGSPVYAGHVSPVIEDYMNNNKVENKKILLYSVGKFTDNTNELEKLKACVSQNNNIEVEKYTESTEEAFLNSVKECI